MKSLWLAFQFLTLIPVGRTIQIEESDLPKSVSFFVFVGFFQGALFLSAELAFGYFFHPNLSLALAMLLLIISNGAFHLDALADTFDALSVRGDRDKKLSVMKGGAVGPIGVVAIIASLSLKYFALQNISHLLPFTYYSSLLFMPIFSKWAMVVALFHGRSVRKDGLGFHFIGRVGVSQVIFSTLTMIGVLLLASIMAGNYVPQGQYFFYCLLLVIIYCLCRLLLLFYNRQFGGLTGDMVGSISEITEVIFLMTVIMWSRLYI